MTIEKIFTKIVKFLEKYEFSYLIIGGIAAGIMGEPRATGDIDINIKIKKTAIKNFLIWVQNEGFTYDQRDVIKRIKKTGTFQILCGDLHIDFLIASTKFEENAMKRSGRIKLFGIEANFPSPEDLILFKIIPSRPIDKIDIANIVLCHKEKLDKKYLLDWAMKLSNQAEDIRIYNDIKKFLSSPE